MKTEMVSDCNSCCVILKKEDGEKWTNYNIMESKV